MCVHKVKGEPGVLTFQSKSDMTVYVTTWHTHKKVKTGIKVAELKKTGKRQMDNVK